MSDRVIWGQALGLLQRQEHGAARELLHSSIAEGRSHSPVDAWVSELLLQLIDGTDGPDEPESPVVTEDASRGISGALVVGQTLRAIHGARVAVRSGRVTELVHHASQSATGSCSDWPWIGMQSAGVLQAAFRFSGDLTTFSLAVEGCTTLSDRLDVPNIAVQARALLGSMYLLTGQFHRTINYCDSAIALAGTTGLAENPSVAMAHQFRGYVLFEWNRLDDALLSLQRAWDVTDARHAGVRSGVARVMAALTSVTGHRDEADKWIARLEEIVAEPMTLRNREWLAAVRTRHGLANKRDLRALDSWRRTYDYYQAPLADLSDTDIVARLHEYEHLLTMLEDAGQWSPLHDVASTVVRGGGTMRKWFHVRGLTAQAVALHGIGNVQQARTVFAEALELGEEGSFVRVFVDGAPIRVQLLRRAASDVATRHFARRVLSAIPDVDMQENLQTVLTCRQLEVLQEVAKGLSNAEIATVLGISVPTVKSHLQAAFTRLGVKSRTGAISILAQEEASRRD